MDTRTCEKCKKYDETSELGQSDQVLCDSCYEKTHQAKEHQASFEENINTAMLDTKIDVHDDDGDNAVGDSDLTVTNPNQARSHNEANEAVASPKISKKNLPQRKNS